MLIHLHPLNASRWEADLLCREVLVRLGGGSSPMRQLSESADGWLIEDLWGDPIL